MNMHGVGLNQQAGGSGGVGMPMAVPGGIMQQASPQQLQQQQVMPPQPQQPLEKLDNISKVKSLVGPLRESLTVSKYVFPTLCKRLDLQYCLIMYVHIHLLVSRFSYKYGGSINSEVNH